jgi:hypothetical protein
MPGYLPGIPGLIAFAGVKFGGYCLAALALKNLQPTVTASAVKIAATRTGLGILIGPPLTIGMALALHHFFPQSDKDFSMAAYAFLYCMRVLVWALVIYLFTRQMSLPKSKFWGYAALGAVWSCILDLPGFGLATITPGRVPFC